MVKIRYRGKDYEGRIVDEMIRHGEKYIEVEIIGWLTSKWLHSTSIKSKVA